MTLLESLLNAISRLEGDALVMHVGEKPYVVTTSSAMHEYRGPLIWGQVELSSKVLTSEGVLSILGQILPAGQRQALDELGAVEYELESPTATSHHFTMVAARGGDDVWLELRRKPRQAAQVEEIPPSDAAPAAPERDSAPTEETPIESPTGSSSVGGETSKSPAIVGEEPQPFEIVSEVEQGPPGDADVDALVETHSAMLSDAPISTLRTTTASIDHAVSMEQPQAAGTDQQSVVAETTPDTRVAETEPQPVAFQESASPKAEAVPLAAAEASLLPASDRGPSPSAADSERSVGTDEALSPHAESHAKSSVPEEEEKVTAAPERDARAVVVPLARVPVRQETSTVSTSSLVQGFSIEELLRVAAARGAATIYVIAHWQPMIRAEGEISALDIGSGAPLAESDVNRLVLDLAPPHARDVWQHGESAEWMCDVAGVGRMRCLTFRDHRGPGLIFRVISRRPMSADQLGLSVEVQALCSQSDGLVLVTGPRASGKSTLLNAFIELINRTRSDHVVTIESQVGFVHESRRSFVSQREVRGDAEAVVSAARAALREDPDVLLIEDLRSADIAAVALEAAESGRLVFGSLPAASTVAAIDRLLELFPADRRLQAQSSLAGTLRGVIAQVLLRRSRGGRVAAREVLLNTPAVAALIEEGKTMQLPLAIESGRRYGMMPLNDALTALVRDATVYVTEAYLKAFDKPGLLNALKRDGVDTSFAERLA